jgi:CheY-like chemotaxis protein
MVILARRPRALSVLIVDRHEDCATSLALLLEANGHTARVACTAEAALAAARQARPDVIVLDPWGLGAGGRTLPRQLVDLPGPRPLVVGMTGYVRAGDPAFGQAAGFDHLFLKPADPSDLLELIEGRALRTA